MLMDLLLDTHVLLWWLLDDESLSAEHKQRIDDAPSVFVSAASVWEVAMKQELGKLAVPASFRTDPHDGGLRELAITLRHAILAGSLPPFHRDPFDRMLVAHARAEQRILLTHDPDIKVRGGPDRRLTTAMGDRRRVRSPPRR